MTSTSVTIDEAVALMINWTYIPEEFSLLDVTGALMERAFQEYLDSVTTDDSDKLQLNLQTHQKLHEMAKHLHFRISYELGNLDDSLLKIAPDSSDDERRLTVKSLDDWAFFECSISIPNQAISKTNVDWKDVTIKIYNYYKISLFVNGKRKKQSDFRELGLMGKLKKEPNQLGGILIGLSQSEKFPKEITVEPKDKTAISKLRDSLIRLTGIKRDPFFPFNNGDGWKPRFKLIDDTRNAENRAKQRAVYVEYDDSKHGSITPDFDDEGDDAAKWLEERNS